MADQLLEAKAASGKALGILRRKRPQRTRAVVVEPLRYGSAVYDVAMAKQTHTKIAEMEVDKLAEPVKVEVPYTGIGVPPSRPGGDLVVLGRMMLWDLFGLFERSVQDPQLGSRIYVSGPIGCGKTVLLRELAVCLLRNSGSRRYICIWNTATAVDNFTEVIKSALCFTYAADEEALSRIGKLESQADVEKFMDDRIAMREQFCFIIDGGEVFDQRGDLLDTNRARALHSFHTLMSKSLVSVICISPMADRGSRKRKAEHMWFSVNDGFNDVECDTYVTDLCVLGRVIGMDLERRAADVKYYAGTHPLSLTVLNKCCWEVAKRKIPAAPCNLRLNQKPTERQEEQVLRALREVEDWEEALNLYVGSEELKMVRNLAREAVSKVKVACHSTKSMAKLDMRFVYGDPDSDGLDAAPSYVNDYIKRIYMEEIRNAEQQTVFAGGAWAPYCRHLLDSSIAVNWAEMGWLCEDFAGEVISMKGLRVEEGLTVPKGRVDRFGTVPMYSSWVQEVKAGGVLLFLPLKYKYRSVDGVLVAQIAGKLHFIAIQVTVNDADHRQSAPEFMSWENIGKWIPAEVRSEWNLHYTFLCLRDEAAQDVRENLRQFKSGVLFGTVGYRLHVVSFTTAFAGLIAEDVKHTLQAVADKRDSAFPATPPQVHPASSIEEMVPLDKLTRPTLLIIAKFHSVDYDEKDTKAVLKDKIVAKVGLASSSYFVS